MVVLAEGEGLLNFDGLGVLDEVAEVVVVTDGVATGEEVKEVDAVKDAVIEFDGEGVL